MSYLRAKTLGNSAQQANRIEVAGEFARIETLLESWRIAARPDQAGAADVAKAKLIEDFILLQGRINLLPDRERAVAQHRLSALELQL